MPLSSSPRFSPALPATPKPPGGVSPQPAPSSAKHANADKPLPLKQMQDPSQVAPSGASPPVTVVGMENEVASLAEIVKAKQASLTKLTHEAELVGMEYESIRDSLGPKFARPSPRQRGRKLKAASPAPMTPSPSSRRSTTKLAPQQPLDILKYTGKVEEITPENKESYFSTLFRDNTIHELDQWINDAEAALIQLRPEDEEAQPDAIAELRSNVFAARKLKSDMQEEREQFSVFFSKMDSEIYSSKRDAERALETAKSKHEAAAQELQQAVLEYAQKVRAAQVACDDYRRRQSQDRIEALARIASRHALGIASGVPDEEARFADSAIQCSIEKDCLEETKRFITVVAAQERAINRLTRDAYQLLQRLETLDMALENAMLCPLCQTRSTDVLVLWPCGHAYCHACISSLQNDNGEFRCSLCGVVTPDLPVPNLVANFISARVDFKDSGYKGLYTALGEFCREVTEIDDTCAKATYSHYRIVAPQEEFQPLRIGLQ